MAALNKLVDSLVKQGTSLPQPAEKGQKPPKAQAGAVLPHWIFEGAPLSYFSQTSQEALDVVIDGISHSKQQVRFVFARDKKTWKAATFAQILGGSNPLKRRGRSQGAAAKAAPAGEKKDPQTATDEDLLDQMEEKWDAAAARESEGRKKDRPALSRIPQPWVKKDVVDVEDVKAVDIDSTPEPLPLVPEDRDPYGLGEEALRDQAPQSSAPSSSKQGKERSKKAHPQSHAGKHPREEPSRRRSRERSGEPSKRREAAGKKGRSKKRERSQDRSKQGERSKRRGRSTDRSETGERSAGSSVSRSKQRRRR